MNHVAKTDRILIVDDENDVAEFLKNVSGNLGFSVRTTDNYEAFCKIQREFDPTVLLLDLQMPGRDGIEYLKFLAKRKSSVKVILASGMDNRTLSTASQLGSVLGLDMAAALQKPIAIHALRQELRKVMHQSQPVTPLRLSAAIKAGRIRPHYQPKVSRDTEGNWTITEVEALARWYQADGSILMPDNFIGLAEENGLLRALTDSMINQVVEQLGRWNKQGLRLRAAVNLSPSLLNDSKLPNYLQRLVEKHEVDCSQLIFEVTEHVVIDYTATTIEVLSRLRVNNFGLAIDDFGTGYSSLEQLYRMPFDELKIDRSFVKRAQTNKDTRIIIEAIVLLGQKLGMQVCAEGVETQEAFDFLAGIGCDKQQGFLIGRPVTPAEITARLNQSGGAAPPAQALILPWSGRVSM